MGLLKSIDNVPGIQYYEYRDFDYFNKFKYRARVTLKGLYHTSRSTNIKQFLTRVKYLSDVDSSILKNLDSFEKFIDFKNNADPNLMHFRIEGDTAGVFSNNLSELQKIKDLGNFEIDFTESITSQYSGVKHFVHEPKHNYRVYLRSTTVDPTLINSLKETLKNNKNLIPSRAFKEWLNIERTSTYYYRYCSATYFIDYDNESTISYLALMYDSILGKKYKLEKR